MKPRRLFIAVKSFSGEAKPGGEAKVSKGSLLRQEDSHRASSEGHFWAKVLDTEKVVRVPFAAVQELSGTHAGLLEAVTNGDERLGLFNQERLMRRLSCLQKGDPVRVQITSASGQKVPGIVRYRGPIEKKKRDTSVVFGVELVGSAAGKGFTDGSFKGQKFFSCRENCGVFVPVNRIEPDDLATGSPPAPPRGPGRDCTRIQVISGDPLSSPRLEVGDRVFFKMEDNTPTGTVAFCDYLPRKMEAGVFVGIHLDKPVGSWDGYFKERKLCRIPAPEYGILLPISKVQKEQVDRSAEALDSNSSPPTPTFFDCPSPSSIRYPPRMEGCSPKDSLSFFPSLSSEKPKARNGEGTEEDQEAGEEEKEEEDQYAPCFLEINSMVEVNDPPIYGVIRWIGDLPDMDERIAGLELEEPLSSSCTDGQYRGTRYFHCPPNKALFVKLRNCRPDSRFGTEQNLENPVLRCNSLSMAQT